MGSAALVDEDIERGREVLNALDDAGFRPGPAFWRYRPESSDWRFVVALPAIARQEPLHVYDQVQRLLSRRNIELPLWRITLLSTDDPLARWARERVRGAFSDTRSSTSFVDDSFIEDAYIYRQHRSV
jgi:hypothetical protein